MARSPLLCFSGWLAGWLPLLAGCASTTAPTAPPAETLLVVNGGDNTLSLIPIDTSKVTRLVPFGPLAAPAQAVAARGNIALVAGGDADVLVVIDLRLGVVRQTIQLEAGSRPVGVTFVSETAAYVMNAGRDVATRVDFETGDTASVVVGRFPRSGALARGRLFVVNGNLAPCPTGLCPAGPSWLTVVDPLQNQRAGSPDSIPLPATGDARSITIGGDGLLYVVSAGDPAAETLGRLTIVDPVRREEVGSFGGFGPVPGSLASDGVERLYVSSVEDGLMEFNTRTRRVVRGAGSGVLIGENVAVAVDSHGRVYAIEAPGCPGTTRGRLRVFRPDLTEARNLLLGVCPTAATIVQIPAPLAE
jgi:DNA-binding beta-propeller fold protein YncE